VREIKRENILHAESKSRKGPEIFPSLKHPLCMDEIPKVSHSNAVNGRRTF
jgi:hypothetical protein